MPITRDHLVSLLITLKIPHTNRHMSLLLLFFKMYILLYSYADDAWALKQRRYPHNPWNKVDTASHIYNCEHCTSTVLSLDGDWEMTMESRERRREQQSTNTIDNVFVLWQLRVTSLCLQLIVCPGYDWLAWRLPGSLRPLPFSACSCSALKRWPAPICVGSLRRIGNSKLSVGVCMWVRIVVCLSTCLSICDELVQAVLCLRPMTAGMSSSRHPQAWVQEIEGIGKKWLVGWMDHSK